MRYVVLYHTGWQEDHYDLLLETSADGPLESYRVYDWPPGVATRVSVNVSHRRLYLEYEGPVSNGRGTVARVAAGDYERIREKPAPEIVLLDSGLRVRLPGTKAE